MDIIRGGLFVLSLLGGFAGISRNLLSVHAACPVLAASPGAWWESLGKLGSWGRPVI